MWACELAMGKQIMDRCECLISTLIFDQYMHRMSTLASVFKCSGPAKPPTFLSGQTHLRDLFVQILE